MKTVYILGAGVDRALGLPLANELLAELGKFSAGEGKEISKVIKDKLGGGNRVRFSFDKYKANQGENFAERMLTDPEMAEKLKSILQEKGSDSSREHEAIRSILEQLDEIRNANQLDDDTADAIARIAGESIDMADDDMLNFRGVSFNSTTRDAVLKFFRSLQSVEGLSEEEQNALVALVASMTDIENLLTELFAGFYTDNATSTRKYLYVSWLLWTYMWWQARKARQNMATSNSFYSLLRDIGDDDAVVTFNYTRLGNFPQDRTVEFHGDCFSYIKYPHGGLIRGDERVTEASSIEEIKRFIGGLDIDIEGKQIVLPAIVPPSAMKPVIHHEFVERWSTARELMNASDLLIVVGYAFNRVDSHFNELFRESAKGKKVAVVNPDIEGIKKEMDRLIGIHDSSSAEYRIESIDTLRFEDLLLVPVAGEKVSGKLFCRILQGW